MRRSGAPCQASEASLAYAIGRPGEMAHALGIDVGTTNAKVALVGSTGRSPPRLAPDHDRSRRTDRRARRQRALGRGRRRDPRGHGRGAGGRGRRRAHRGVQPVLVDRAGRRRRQPGRRRWSCTSTVAGTDHCARDHGRVARVVRDLHRPPRHPAPSAAGCRSRTCSTSSTTSPTCTRRPRRTSSRWTS